MGRGTLTCDHFIAWNDPYILKVEPYYRKRRIAESFLINKRAKAVNVLNRNDGVVFHPYILCLEIKKIFCPFV